MQCPSCGVKYTSGSYCTVCENDSGGAVRLIASVSTTDLREYIRFLDVCLCDGFFSAKEQRQCADKRRRYGISQKQHEEILVQNGYQYLEEIPIRCVMNFESVKGFYSGQPCLLRMRLVNVHSEKLKGVTVKYWLNDSQQSPIILNNVDPNDIKEQPLRFAPDVPGQHTLSVEFVVDFYTKGTHRFECDPIDFQVFPLHQKTTQVQNVFHDIVVGGKLNPDTLPTGMLLGKGRWQEIELQPKQESIEWGEWTSKRKFAAITKTLKGFQTHFDKELEFQHFICDVDVLQKNGESFVQWESRLDEIDEQASKIARAIQARKAKEEQLRVEIQNLKTSMQTALKQYRKELGRSPFKSFEQSIQWDLAQQADEDLSMWKSRLLLQQKEAKSKFEEHLDAKLQRKKAREIAKKETERKKKEEAERALQEHLEEKKHRERQRRIEEEERRNRNKAEAETRRKKIQADIVELTNKLKHFQHNVQLEQSKMATFEPLRLFLSRVEKQIADIHQVPFEQKKTTLESYIRRNADEYQKLCIQMDAWKEEEKQRVKAERDRMYRRKFEKLLIDVKAEGERQVGLVSPHNTFSLKERKWYSKIERSYSFVRVPSGWFVFGSVEQAGVSENEKPYSTVRLTEDLYVGTTPVPQWLWEQVMGKKGNPSHFVWPEYPVDSVTWGECIEFCNQLSILHELNPVYKNKLGTIVCDWRANGYRLLSEAEWEYCAKGTRHPTPKSQSVKTLAWYKKNSEGHTQPVGTKGMNPFHLYDMQGNVFEWVWDYFGMYTHVQKTDPTGPSNGDTRVMRGGAWNVDKDQLRITHRRFRSPKTRMNYVGLRIACRASDTVRSDQIFSRAQSWHRVGLIIGIVGVVIAVTYVTVVG